MVLIAAVHVTQLIDTSTSTASHTADMKGPVTLITEDDEALGRTTLLSFITGLYSV